MNPTTFRAIRMYSWFIKMNDETMINLLCDELLPELSSSDAKISYDDISILIHNTKAYSDCRFHDESLDNRDTTYTNVIKCLTRILTENNNAAENIIKALG